MLCLQNPKVERLPAAMPIIGHGRGFSLLTKLSPGLTLADEQGKHPKGPCTWQFNFKFNLTEDMYAQVRTHGVRTQSQPEIISGLWVSTSKNNSKVQFSPLRICPHFY